MSKPSRKRRTKHHMALHEIDGVKKTLVEWAEQYGLTIRQVSQRMRRSRSLKDALTCEVQLKHGSKYPWRAPANPVLTAFLRHPAPPPPP